MAPPPAAEATLAKKLSSDAPLFAVTVALLGLGLVMVWSASSGLSQERYGNAYHFVVRQVVWACVGLVCMVAAMRLDYRKLRHPAVVYSVVVVTTVLLIAVLFMRPVNDTHRWLRFGELSLQPAELAKLATILFLAYHLERRGERINDFLPSLFPVLLLLGWFAFLVFIQPDLGTAATLGLIGCVMLFLAGVRLRYFAALGVVAVPLMVKAVMMAAYRRDRIEAYLNPWSDARGSGYQIIQSLIAVGTGGVTGVGLMEGRQKLFYLPYPYSDFIFAVIGEELGLIGATVVLAGFVLLLWRGVRAAWNAPDPFGTYLAAGLTLSIVLQALINVSVVLGLLPTKGIPLPFISAGGSSLLFTLVSVGLILNVSQHAD
jgi:cell division protein FtsW